MKKGIVILLLVTAGALTVRAGNSCVIRLDTRVGMVVPKATETLTFDARWGDGASSVVKVDGVTLENASGAGSVEWTPEVCEKKVWTVTWTCGEEELTRKFCTLDVLKREYATQTFARVEASAKMITPKQMQVDYIVRSNFPETEVNAVAFKDGVRSFANAVVVRTALEGQIMGIVPCCKWQSFVWNVPSDWDAKLEKVSVEVMAKPGELLPQQKVTIPANGNNPAMTITRNAVPEATLFNALLWCYAEGDERLHVTDGKVYVDGVSIAVGNKVYDPNGINSVYYNGSWVACNNSKLLNLPLRQDGYERLSWADLEYARKMTRLDLKSSGIEQVSKKKE